MKTKLPRYRRKYVIDRQRKPGPTTCEHCGKTRIRYIHVIIQRKTGERLYVGGECARQLAGYDPTKAEKSVRQADQRRKRFVNSQVWRESAKGNPYRKYSTPNGIIVITIFPREDGYAWCFVDGEQPIYSDQTFDTVNDAKLDAFDTLQELLQPP